MTIASLIQETFAGMDSRGYFPAQPCRQCGNALQGADSDRPAELYAGTYTGLCYTCERGPGFIAQICELDGMRVWDYPPHCPSYRRDRETFTAYPDCQECEGLGCKFVSRSFGQGGPYYSQCGTCSVRRSKHPARIWARKRMCQIFEVANRIFQAEQKLTGEVDLFAKEKAPATDRYTRANAMLGRICKARGISFF